MTPAVGWQGGDARCNLIGVGFPHPEMRLPMAMTFRSLFAALPLVLASACHHSESPLDSGPSPAPAEVPGIPPEGPSLSAPAGIWLAGDLHVHSDHSSDGSALRQGLNQQGPGNVSVADQIGQGVRSGLVWMPLTDHRTYDQHYDPLWDALEPRLSLRRRRRRRQPLPRALAGRRSRQPGDARVQRRIQRARHLAGTARRAHRHPHP